jgi:hypothetical protein
LSGTELPVVRLDKRGDSLDAKYRSQQIGIGNFLRPWPRAWGLRFGTLP